ncbi:thioredoxin domain-containing protein [Paraflavisolibacter sp. H34]|uniref:thioredoxin domain-containing protein n=1 Tax=Huijunlia imazamoxiresistens TaxID=3127457 RepID=UPI003016FC5E
MPTNYNRLIHESSPYLLQHAQNPVDWFPWGTEAFEKAKQEDKPVLVSIGYAACHWCHVMERESFEDPGVAALMNEHFVSIKVDREERPDVDHLYMDAVQAIAGSGGWPLNVFLTPEGKPFYGGTYYPPARAFNRASWTEVLQAVHQAYKEQRNEIEGQATELTEHLKANNQLGRPADGFAYDPGQLDAAFRTIMAAADTVEGGFGQAPKFPQTFTLTFLLRYGALTGNREALKQAFLSLDKMIRGGIYDQLGGGFARYSTDGRWLVPHFEKMLYDNALLAALLAEAYQLSGNERYREVLAETLGFVERELQHEGGGFFSALDADSEGEEGRFYVWEAEEVEQVLGSDASLFCQYYNITEKGNWEGRNILHTSASLADFAAQHNIHPENLWSFLDGAKAALFRRRSERVRPALDDKVILSWNALMNLAYSKAYAATGEEGYREKAVTNMRFLLEAFADGSGGFYHTWKNGRARHRAFLDDYACLVQALLCLGQVSGELHWLQQAGELTGYVLEHFADEGSELFYYTHAGQDDILLRKKEVYDAAIPSGNSMMALNLYQLSIVTDEITWRRKADAMMAAFGSLAVKYPTSFGLWLTTLQEITLGTNEIALVGPDVKSYLKNVLRLYLPHSLILASVTADEKFPLLRSKENNGDTLIFLCRNYTCQNPVSTIEEFKQLLSVKIFS